MRLPSCFIPQVILIIPVLIVITPGSGEAVSRITANLSLEKTFSSGQKESPEVLTGGASIEIIPAIRKIRTRFIIPLQFSMVGGESNFNAFPVGNFGADFTGDVYNVNLQYGRSTSVSNTAQLTDVSNSRLGFSLFIPDLPRVNASFFRTDVTEGGRTNRIDSVSLFSNYRYRWLNFKGGATLSKNSLAEAASTTSSSLLFGMGGNYEILPRTTIFASYDFNRFASETAASESTTITNKYGAGFESRPIEWLGVGGNFEDITTTHESGTDDVQQTMGLNTRLFLPGKVQISPSMETSSFNDRGKKRKVTTYTLAASYHERLIEKILLGLNASRSYDYDPSQGTNVRDNFGVNAVMDVTPRLAVRLNLNVSRHEDRQFVVEKSYNASGTLAERSNYDDRPAGFTFFDTENYDLYTKNSAAIGDWSTPVHIGPPVTEQFNVSKSVQLNMIPTDKTNLIFTYTSSASSDQLDFARIGSQSMSGSLNYSPKRSTTFGLFANARLPEIGTATYSGTVSITHQLRRGPQVNVNYSWQSQGKALNNFYTRFTFPLRKRTTLDVSYSASQFLEDDQSYVLRLRLSKSF